MTLPGNIERRAPERAETDRVGPVLEAGDRAAAVVRAICELNPEAEVLDRRSYLRVLCPRRCTVTRAAIEHCAAERFELPGDLEAILLSFRGKLTLDAQSATWELESTPMAP